jgi:hypothetical protein
VEVLVDRSALHNFNIAGGTEIETYPIDSEIICIGPLANHIALALLYIIDWRQHHPGVISMSAEAVKIKVGGRRLDAGNYNLGSFKLVRGLRGVTITNRN